MGGFDALVLLGPTASGKTRLGVQLARSLGGEILSADSRQVYRGLDIGTGKDLQEYRTGGEVVPYHLIDIVDLDSEFSVFAFQKTFFESFREVTRRKTLPVVVGGTGLYLDALISGYNLVETPENRELRTALSDLSDEELVQRLQLLKSRLHNTTDLVDRNRLIRAIEIAEYSCGHSSVPTPQIRPLVLGTQWERSILRKRIGERLKARLDAGLVEEVEQLHEKGISWERLEWFGLEYRYITGFLRGQIKSKNDLFQKLNSAIAQFAKKQETWFRRMERNGVRIHWIPEAEFDSAMQVVSENE